MSTPTNGGTTRREMMTTTGKIAVASALAGMAIPQVHAGESNTLQVALVGCGGRGTGAAANALSTHSGPVKLVAMADVFRDRLDSSYKDLKRGFQDKVDVPESRRFIGFDAYQKAMDCLKPGDIAIFATPPAFRWVHFGHAIAKNLNVFMEKPISVDGPSSAKMFALGEEAKKKNLKVGVGLMCRHCAARHELYDRIKSGQIGDLMLLRAYRVKGPEATQYTLPYSKNSGMTELLYQIRRFHAFLWASGGCFSDFLIHNIDECCWMKDAWPVEAKGYGGRHYRGAYIDQNFDHYTVEYTFADGAKLMLEGRNIDGCDSEFASYAHGTKGSAVISSNSHTPAHCRMFKGQVIPRGHGGRGKKKPANLIWEFGKPEPDPYQLEWEHLVQAIRADKPYNEVKRGAEASLVTAMGRMACHTGRIIRYDDMLACKHAFAPEVDKLTLESPAPIRAGSDGKYPVPQPGIKTDREF